MVFYFIKLEYFIEKWQSHRRKTIEISQPTTSKTTQNQVPPNQFSFNNQQINDLSKSISTNEREPEKKENKPESNTKTMSYKTILENSEGNNQNNKPPIFFHNCTSNRLTTCPGLLYLSLVILSFSLCIQMHAYNATPIIKPNNIESGGGGAGKQVEALVNQIQSQASNSQSIAGSKPQVDLKGLSAKLIEQMGAVMKLRSNRWIHVPSNVASQIRDQPIPNTNYITRTINRISSRIGSRNTIRVHNAFRDFAWRILSRLSMPTPVIYELRRQNFYSPEDDLKNDSLFNKNTTKTIRTRRHAKVHRDEDDDESDNTLRERLRNRLEDLVNISRRSRLFGRVIRMPSLFPFKRQEDVDKTSAIKQTNAQQAGSSNSRKRLFRRRKKKESDRQMIFINGKQYYIDDDNELKEVKPEKEASN